MPTAVAPASTDVSPAQSERDIALSEGWIDSPVLQLALADLAAVCGVDLTHIDIQAIREAFASPYKMESPQLNDSRFAYSIERFTRHILDTKYWRPVSRRASVRDTRVVPQYNRKTIVAEYKTFIGSSIDRPRTGADRISYRLTESRKAAQSELFHRWTEISNRFANSDLGDAARNIAHQLEARRLTLSRLFGLEPVAIGLESADLEEFKAAKASLEMFANRRLFPRIDRSNAAIYLGSGLFTIAIAILITGLFALFALVPGGIAMAASILLNRVINRPVESVPYSHDEIMTMLEEAQRNARSDISRTHGPLRFRIDVSEETRGRAVRAANRALSRGHRRVASHGAPTRTRRPMGTRSAGRSARTLTRA